MFVEDGLLDGCGDRVLGREGPAEIEEHPDVPVAWVGHQRPQRRQPAERETRFREHRVVEQDAEQRDVHHEPLHLALGGGQVLVAQVAGDDAGVVRAVPAAG
ncbi:hypothetical protein [Streptomyces wuyuanensis]|uniref:hypothetical protein n=1 Tax=Streptomyces wuyuanensis TaxID=1196353 RepID=UPI00115F95D3|nr:hypothetical protein [Streptomyces wuyuanensis]